MIIIIIKGFSLVYFVCFYDFVFNAIYKILY